MDLGDTLTLRSVRSVGHTGPSRKLAALICIKRQERKEKNKIKCNFAFGSQHLFKTDSVGQSPASG